MLVEIVQSDNSDNLLTATVRVRPGLIPEARTSVRNSKHTVNLLSGVFRTSCSLYTDFVYGLLCLSGQYIVSVTDPQRVPSPPSHLILRVPHQGSVFASYSFLFLMELMRLINDVRHANFD